MIVHRQIHSGEHDLVESFLLQTKRPLHDDLRIEIKCFPLATWTLQ